MKRGRIELPLSGSKPDVLTTRLPLQYIVRINSNSGDAMLKDAPLKKGGEPSLCLFY